MTQRSSGEKRNRPLRTRTLEDGDAKYEGKFGNTEGIALSFNFLRMSDPRFPPRKLLVLFRDFKSPMIGRESSIRCCIWSMRILCDVFVPFTSAFSLHSEKKLCRDRPTPLFNFLLFLIEHHGTQQDEIALAEIV